MYHYHSSVVTTIRGLFAKLARSSGRFQLVNGVGKITVFATTDTQSETIEIV